MLLILFILFCVLRRVEISTKGKIFCSLLFPLTNLLFSSKLWVYQKYIFVWKLYLHHSHWSLSYLHHTILVHALIWTYTTRQVNHFFFLCLMSLNSSSNLQQFGYLEITFPILSAVKHWQLTEYLAQSPLVTYVPFSLCVLYIFGFIHYLLIFTYRDCAYFLAFLCIVGAHMSQHGCHWSSNCLPFSVTCVFSICHVCTRVYILWTCFCFAVLVRFCDSYMR